MTIKLVKCENCSRCKVKYWFVHCDKNMWKWEMLQNSNLSSYDRQSAERPVIDIPKALNNNACSCEHYDDMNKEG